MESAVREPRTPRAAEKRGAGFLSGCLRLAGPWVCYLVAPPVTFAYFLACAGERRALLEVHRRAGRGPVAAWAGAYLNFLFFAFSMMDRLFAFRTGRFPSIRVHGHVEDAWLRDGAILIGAHFGDWSLCGAGLPRARSRKVHIVMDLSVNPAFASQLGGIAGADLGVIDAARGTIPLLLAVKEALDAGEVVCFLADRGPRDARCEWVDFLGRAAPWHLGPFELAVRFRKPLLEFTCVKEGMAPTSPYGVALTPLWLGAVDGDASPDPRGLLRRYVAVLEKRVTSAPRHWFNFFPFWTTLR